MRIYNTLTRRVEEIVPLEAGKIKMYSCGPTVYRYIHIGNLRTFTMADWIRRIYEYHAARLIGGCRRLARAGEVRPREGKCQQQERGAAQRQQQQIAQAALAN